MAYDPKPWKARQSGNIVKRFLDHRPEEERDRSRIIHSAAFRRLQGKTQVLGIAEGDFHRTRLTHSMEVAQIARGLVLQFKELHKNNVDLHSVLPTVPQIETIGFAHDLGHPPFGHRGEIALNYMMREYGGFEGNGQSLRILSRLELHTHRHGLDLTRRSLLGILKYPAPYSALLAAKLPSPVTELRQLKASDWKPPKCYLDTESDVVDWLLEPLASQDRQRFLTTNSPSSDTKPRTTKYKTLDASLMELADDIAYGVHDLEDGIALGLITEKQWSVVDQKIDSEWANSVNLNKDALADQLFSKFSRPGQYGNRKLAIGEIINILIASAEPERRNEFDCDLLDWHITLDPRAKAFLECMHDVKYDTIIKSQEVQTLEYRGQQMVMHVFDSIASDPESLLDETSRREIEGQADVHRTICDYVAGMTDAYCTRLYERLYIPRQGSIFERL